MAKSTLAKRTIVPGSWRVAQSDPTLLLRMAADAKRARDRAARITELRTGIRDPETGKKLSQERLAADMNVSSRTVQNWERGGELDDENRKLLAEYFTRKHGSLVTEDYIEHGVTRRERPVTPEPVVAAVRDDTVALLLAKLDTIEEQLRLLRAENEVRAMEVREQIERALAPNPQTQRRRRA